MYNTDNLLAERGRNPQACQCNGSSLYPLFETMLHSKGLRLQATYTCQDIATLFGVTARTIQSKVKDRTLPSRKLIGGGRFLPIDIENYLQKAETSAVNASAMLSVSSPLGGFPQ